MKIKDLKESCNTLSSVINGKSNDNEEIENYKELVNSIPKEYQKKLIENLFDNFSKNIEQTDSGKKEVYNTIKFSTTSLNEKDKVSNEQSKEDFWKTFEYLNILFKGVPGTGKSYVINNIVEKHLNLNLHSDNVLRINIHSASSNSDLMQGIGISSNDGKIQYDEKQGLILDIIKRATFNPNQPFVLILEEIQENNLNELIGDLIYLIEDEKRSKLEADNKEYNSYEELVNTLVDSKKITYYVKIPFLVRDNTVYRKMILPKNLYIFCTSNYRDDKKVIEDNLLRRFEVIEIYPKKGIASEYTREFFEALNSEIKKELSDEIHPDRFMIGHAIFQKVSEEKDFYRVLLKIVTEFKDIKEVDFDTFKSIIEKTESHIPKNKNTNEVIIKLKLDDNYYGLITQLQEKIEYEFLKETIIMDIEDKKNLEKENITDE